MVNNVGILTNYAPAELIPLKDFNAVFSVNFFSTVSVCHTFLPLLRQSRGRLINVSSVASEVGIPGMLNYVASKAAIMN